MDLLDVEKMLGPEREKMHNAIKTAVQHYSNTAKDPDRTKEELVQAGNDALRAMGDLIDLQNDAINGLITASQLLADTIEGKERRPSS